MLCHMVFKSIKCFHIKYNLNTEQNVIARCIYSCGVCTAYVECWMRNECQQRSKLAINQFCQWPLWWIANLHRPLFVCVCVQIARIPSQIKLESKCSKQISIFFNYSLLYNRCLHWLNQNDTGKWSKYADVQHIPCAVHNGLLYITVTS